MRKSLPAPFRFNLHEIIYVHQPGSLSPPCLRPSEESVAPLALLRLFQVATANLAIGYGVPVSRFHDVLGRAAGGGRDPRGGSSPCDRPPALPGPPEQMCRSLRSVPELWWSRSPKVAFRTVVTGAVHAFGSVVSVLVEECEPLVRALSSMDGCCCVRLCSWPCAIIIHSAQQRMCVAHVGWR
jgi:hypothetical protein